MEIEKTNLEMIDLEMANVEAIKKEVEAEDMPAEAEVCAIQRQAAQNAGEIMALDLAKLDEKRGILRTIDDLAMDVLQASARKNSLLQTTIGNLSKAGEDGSVVSTSLADLHREIKSLDPSVLDFAKSGFLDKVFNPVRRYFEKYTKADGLIKDILLSLDKGRDTLKNDNTTLDLEEDALHELTKRLNMELALGMALDEELEKRIAQAHASGEDAEKIRFATEEILFPLRQRVMDMQQMLVVNHQGIIALQVVKRNNKELMRGVDRAKTVTVTALRTAVMVASALYNQKIVLRKIDSLNETTSNLIASTSRMLKEQGVAIQKQAAQSAVSPDVLKQAFEDALSALDDVSAFKYQALPKMQETVAQFRALAQTGEKEIARLAGAKV